MDLLLLLLFLLLLYVYTKQLWSCPDLNHTIPGRLRPPNLLTRTYGTPEGTFFSNIYQKRNQNIKN